MKKTFLRTWLPFALSLGLAGLVLIFVWQIVLAAPRSGSLANPLTFKWHSCYPGNWCETGWYASPAVADLDQDGTAEVLWGGGARRE